MLAAAPPLGHGSLSGAAPPGTPPAVPGANTFYTAPSLGAGLRGIELDRCYVGDYVAGRRHGFGTYTYPNTFFKYEGQWVNGLKHGLGKLSMRDGACYEGEFVEGEIIGQGTRRFANGDVYIGTFELGEMHGFGVMRKANGDCYQGPFEHNAYQGVGVYTYASGDVFEGDFLRHQRTGQGRLTRTDGSRYEGGWVDGEESGQGEAVYADGGWYRGSWSHGRYEGAGEWLQARTGLMYRGEFVGGAPALLPTSLTMTWITEEDPRAKRKAAAKGEPEGPTPMPIVLGEPIPAPITLAAQLQEALPPRTPTPPPDPKQKNKAPSTPPGPVPVTVLNQPPQKGYEWRTADNEYGRQVFLTLHAEPPKPLPPDRLLCCLLLTAAAPAPAPSAEGQDGPEPDGPEATAGPAPAAPVVRLHLSTVWALEPALPLTRVNGEVVTTVQLELAAGQTTVEGLAIGSTDDWDRLVRPDGLGYLVASAPEVSPVAPGVLRVALPDPKTKKPGSK
ncbi:hypothetical protein HYH03_011770 [Edaphochlamys debaryana]|uniref:MORN repeat protein n=1 Tax=Edaphochlamys debaryana TaxID=47281 RepID=A0A836BUQ5_9CHLO|nr:hypothetical protein HYH03_011770 [Edaphochlamys debaryana]|eukprot:KAG2489821.1 hypothetical protein HYH03_011770 [Edaphochlamys debaryana]